MPLSAARKCYRHSIHAAFTSQLVEVPGGTVQFPDSFPCQQGIDRSQSDDKLRIINNTFFNPH
jgi:hypothetical protein